MTNLILQRPASAPGARTKRLLAAVGTLALCLAACATYEEAPVPQRGGNDTEGKAGTNGGSGGNADNTPQGGSGAEATGGAVSLPEAGSNNNAGGVATGGAETDGGSEAGGSAGAAPANDGGEGGAPPVTDNCPADPAKTAPGVCGCGFPDVDTALLASCLGLKNALVHRYDFEGTGTVVTDRIGTSHGSVKGGAGLSQSGGKGVVALGGGSAGSYVDLPNGLVSALTNATLEAWVTWGGGDAWQRIFDFGDSTNATPEDNPASGKSYLFVTPATDPSTGGKLRAVYSLNGGVAAAETRVDASVAMPTVLTQVALVVDSAGRKLSLYVNGVSVGEQTFAGRLASINDVNAWLGRSQYSADPELKGTFHDFRIYEAALTRLQIATSFAAGPDPTFLLK